MPFPLKIHPIELKPAVKSRFKRLLERQFSTVLRISAPNCCHEDVSEDFEPSSVCLVKMVENFIEETNEKPKCGRNLCSCFNGNCDDEHDPYKPSSPLDALEILKSLVPSACVPERNLLADIARIVEKNKIGKRKDGICSKILRDSLAALGYHASICNSRWAKTPSFPAGEYEYVDVMIESERFLIDIDFRSEFEIARSTKAYKLVLQMLPNIFVGKADRLEKIIDIVSESAEQSLNKKGMPFPPWRKADYVKSKWLSAYTHHNLIKKSFLKSPGREKMEGGDDEKDGAAPTVLPWFKPRGGKIVAGLASIIQDES